MSGLSPADDVRGPAATRPTLMTHIVHLQFQPTRPIEKSSGVSAAVLSCQASTLRNRPWQSPKEALAHHGQAGKRADPYRVRPLEPKTRAGLGQPG